MDWVDDAKRVVISYSDNYRELKHLSTGQINDPELSEYAPIRISYLTKAIKAVDYTLAIVSNKPDGEKINKLFTLVYKNKSHKLFSAALLLNITESESRKYNQYILHMIALRMGFYPSDT